MTECTFYNLNALIYYDVCCGLAYLQVSVLVYHSSVCLSTLHNVLRLSHYIVISSFNNKPKMISTSFLIKMLVQAAVGLSRLQACVHVILTTNVHADSCR